MAARRRRRLRAADLGAPRPSRTLPALGAVAVAVSLLFTFKTYVGDDAGELLDVLGVDPLLQLPQSLSTLSPTGALAEGDLARLSGQLARAASACLDDAPAAGRLDVRLTVDGAGALQWGAGELDEGAVVPALLPRCVAEAAARLQLQAPLGGPAQVRLMIPIFKAKPAP